jgi:sensor histidine kinase regulating citrate/malate metabolism
VKLTNRVSLLEGGAGFYVADDEPGIPPAIRDAIFNQGISTMIDRTGFSLAIIKRIAEIRG